MPNLELTQAELTTLFSLLHNALEGTPIEGPRVEAVRLYERVRGLWIANDWRHRKEEAHG